VAETDDRLVPAWGRKEGVCPGMAIDADPTTFDFNVDPVEGLLPGRPRLAWAADGSWPIKRSRALASKFFIPRDKFARHF
jgi:hypothetical protein